MAGLTVLTGVIAGSYPAIYLSALNPVVVLKGKLARSAGALIARKGLVVFQFTLSIALIIAVLVVRKQMEFVLTKNLGYTRDNVIYFDKEGRVAANYEAFLTEARKIPGIVNASLIGQNIIGLNSSTYGLSWEGKKQNDLIVFADAGVEYGMIETLGIAIAEGRSFSREHGSDSSAIIFNEAAIAVMGLKDPVGKSVNLWGKNREIVGVVKDFNFESLHEPVKPLLFIVDPPRTTVVMARIKAGIQRRRPSPTSGSSTRRSTRVSRSSTGSSIRITRHCTLPKPGVAELSRYFAGLAIIISCLGLFGLAAFAAERRVKEIGIRKVLGASIPEIIYLISGKSCRLGSHRKPHRVAGGIFRDRRMAERVCLQGADKRLGIRPGGKRGDDCRACHGEFPGGEGGKGEPGRIAAVRVTDCSAPCPRDERSPSRLITRRLNGAVLHHQHDGLPGSPGPVHDTF